jgi:GNAT superfamily N-acetyltransferase
MKIIEANSNQVKDLAILFDAYRVFYKQESNIEAAKSFLLNRLKQKDSIIYLAYIDDKAVGFTQLYPLFSSVSMKPMYILNDLYVDSNYRGKGIGEALINKAKSFSKEKQIKGLAIQTAFNNPAQHLYLRLGFVKDTDLQFFWTSK